MDSAWKQEKPEAGKIPVNRTDSPPSAVLGNLAPTRIMIEKKTSLPTHQIFVPNLIYGNRQEQLTKTLTKDIKPIYVPSAARFKRASESATLSCSCFDPKCSHIQPHHTGEKAKSQPNETCVVELGSAVQVR